VSFVQLSFSIKHFFLVWDFFLEIGCGYMSLGNVKIKPIEDSYLVFDTPEDLDLSSSELDTF
jgi:hypothetical protein